MDIIIKKNYICPKSKNNVDVIKKMFDGTYEIDISL